MALEQITEHYKNGTIQSTYHLLDGDLHGQYKVWHPEGTVKRIANYSRGERNGHYIDFYPNGQVCEEFFYLNDNPHGEYKRHGENGSLVFHVIYVHGDVIIKDAKSITDKEKFLLTLRHGIQWL